MDKRYTDYCRWCLDAKLYPTLCDPWTVAHQTPLSTGFPRQECGSGSPFPSPEELPNPGVRLMSSTLAGGFFTSEPPGKPLHGVPILID